jgi:hypothetical protein
MFIYIDHSYSGLHEGQDRVVVVTGIVVQDCIKSRSRTGSS